MQATPTVTKLLGLLDKPALLKWANKIGLEGTSLDDHRRNSQSKGNNWHNEIESALKIGREIEDPILRENFHKFIDKVEVLGFEQRISCDHWKGRYDIKFKAKGKTYLCDFKSNAKRVYLENKLQLVAYSEIEKVDEVGIISVPDFTFLSVHIEDRKPYVDILKSLSTIFKCKEAIS